jgi:regulator of sirC expression with transglutaminase-like and TPR domain
MLFGEEKNTFPLPIEKLERLFYELEFSEKDNLSIKLGEIGSLIPWQANIVQVIDELRDPTNRALGRKYFSEIKEARLASCYKRLASKKNDYNYDYLEQGVFLLSSIGDPEANYETYRKEMGRITQRLRDLFEANHVILTDDVKIHLLTRVLYQEEGFHGNKEFYLDPDNSYITRVLKSKLGIPISLSVIYMLIAKKLNLPVYGISMPLHFILQYETEAFMVYLDPFHNGTLLTKKDCVDFLITNGYQDQPEYFNKVETLYILERMHYNLINIFKKTGESWLEARLKKNLILLEREPGQV